MKKLLNILGALLLSITIISCSNETKDTYDKPNIESNDSDIETGNREIIEILKQKTIISGKAESF